MNTSILIALLLILFFSTLVRSTFGFGDALVAMPLLVLVVELNLARAIVALVSITVALVVLLRDWRKVRGSGVWHLVVSALIGIPIGVYGVASFDKRIVKLLLGVIITGYSTFCLLRPRLPVLKSERLAWAFGFVSGVLGGAYNTAGPPLVIYGTARRWNAQDFRATLQGAFLPISLCIIFWHAQADLVTNAALY